MTASHLYYVHTFIIYTFSIYIHIAIKFSSNIPLCFFSFPFSLSFPIRSHSLFLLYVFFSLSINIVALPLLYIRFHRCDIVCSCVGYTCLCVGNNPNHGYTNFDNFMWSMLTTFQLITLDYWENVYNMVSIKFIQCYFKIELVF